MQKGRRLVVLDALRAIAGLTVPLFHICEAFYGRPGERIESYCGHGYLAVEFFLILMGYMLGFAYDGRWQKDMGLGGFFKRRLVRLHPLVVSGVALGLLVALVQTFVGIPWIGWFKNWTPMELCGYSLWAATMVPVFTQGLLNPFNACSWTLYYEYAANILYALIFRHLNKKVLGACVGVALFFWLSYVFHWNLNSLFGVKFELLDRIAGIKNCSIVGGWSTKSDHVYCGFVRLALPFLWGLLLSRFGWRIKPSLSLRKGHRKIEFPQVAFWGAVAIFVAILYTPTSYRLGGPGHLWVNGVFELLAITVVFPLLLLLGVGVGTSNEGKVAKTCVFFAELSYPLYMSHYPLMAILGWWARTYSGDCSMTVVVSVQIVVYLALIGFASLVMRFWDRPMQRLLGGVKASSGEATQA
ncbi:MAG: acyltransferase [bacterium]|nr:acyltransferase [bacterium]